ncbi:MAG: symmetrical bis(5'-nucleosyl)-tetraphosphatase [Betaproteobacteria bacterium]|nr:symmetrical bis(5'-nucleosyl)-tetraphosphatase [Betaproteobacteria bacterium]
MSTWAIGDVQGCYAELCALLDKIGFDPRADRLWFVGDLVNRGPASLETIRFVKSLGERAVTVLGNHDLHLVARAYGFAKDRHDDTLEAVLAAPDRAQIIDWLRERPLMHQSEDHVMVHAGLLPQWSIARALELAREVEQALRGPRHLEFLGRMYGSDPDTWHDDLTGVERLRVIVNAMTRMRFCTAEGRMEFRAKGEQAPPGFHAWFEAPGRRNAQATIVCGHWSALGLKLAPGLIALDAGCVWGGALTAVRLGDRTLVQVPCGRVPAQ